MENCQVLQPDLFLKVLQIEPLTKLPLFSEPVQNIVVYLFTLLFSKYGFSKISEIQSHDIEGLIFQVCEKKSLGAYGWFVCSSTQKHFTENKCFSLSFLSNYPTNSKKSNVILSISTKSDPQTIWIKIGEISDSLDKPYKFKRLLFLNEVLKTDVLPLSSWVIDAKTKP